MVPKYCASLKILKRHFVKKQCLLVKSTALLPKYSLKKYNLHDFDGFLFKQTFSGSTSAVRLYSLLRALIFCYNILMPI